MGIRQIIKGLDGSQQSIGYSAAVPAGLQYINFFGGDVDQGETCQMVGHLPAWLGTQWWVICRQACSVLLILIISRPQSLRRRK